MNTLKDKGEEKMSKFNQEFKEPVHYPENNEYRVSSELYSKEQAYEVFKKEFSVGFDCYDKNFTVDDIFDDRVRWCCQYDYDEDAGRCAWWSGATGKGSKPVWVLEMKNI
jgi:hypothetical protein